MLASAGWLDQSVSAQTASIVVREFSIIPEDERFRSFAGVPQTFRPGEDNIFTINPPVDFRNRQAKVRAVVDYSFDLGRETTSGAFFSCNFFLPEFPDEPGVNFVIRVNQGESSGNASGFVGEGEMGLAEGLEREYNFRCRIVDPASLTTILAEQQFVVKQRYQPLDTIRVVSIDPDPSQPLIPNTAQTFVATVEYTRDVIRLGSQIMLVAADGFGNELIPRNANRLNPSAQTARGDGPNPVQIELTLEDVPVPSDGEMILVAEQVNGRQFGEWESASFATYNSSDLVIYDQDAPLDLSIDHMEVVQVVQDANNGVRLIRRKPTLVRVFTKIESGPDDILFRVPVELQGSRNGSALPGSPLAPINSGQAFATKNPDRTNILHSHDFRLPDAWVDGDELTLEAVVNAEMTIDEANMPPTTKPNSLVRSFSLSRTRGLRVRYLDVCMQPAGEEIKCPSLNTGAVGGFTRTVFPLEPESFSYQPLPVPIPLWPSDLFSVWKLGRALKKARFMNFINRYFAQAVAGAGGLIEFDQLAVWIPDGVAGPLLGTSDPLWANGQGRVMWNVDRSDQSPMLFLDTEVTLAHELAHMFGVRHPNTPDGCGAQDGDSPWPQQFPDATIQEQGYDVEGYRFKSRNKHDLMSYCQPASNFWMSPFNYDLLFNSQFLPRNQPAPEARVMLTGIVFQNEDTGELDPAIPLMDTIPVPASDPNGDYCLTFQQNGSTLGAHCFQPQFLDRETREALPAEPFSFTLAVPTGAARVALTREGRELDAITVSASAPTVAITSPQAGEVRDGSETINVAWTAMDADGDELTYSVFVSSDGGTNYLPAAIDLTDTGYSLDASAIEGGSQVFIRVAASDGWNTTQAEVGPLTINQQSGIASLPDPIDFGRTPMGVPLDGLVRFRNSGSGPLTVSEASSDASQFALAPSQLPLIVKAGAVGALRATFVGDAVGPASANITIRGEGAESSVAIQATVVDADTPILQAAAGPIEFGEAAVSETRTAAFTLRNAGLAELSGTWTLSGDAFVRGETTSGVFLLAAGERMDLPLLFAPEAAGGHMGSLELTSNDPAREQVSVVLRGIGVAVPEGPRVNAGGVVDAAGFRPLLSRGSIASIFGLDLASSTAGATSAPLPVDLSGTQVLVDGVPAPLFFVSQNQINFQVPFEATLEGTAQLAVSADTGASSAVAVTLAPYAPSVFANPATGEPIITQADNSLVNAQAPARGGDVLVVYLTGVGELDNPPASGAASGAAPLARALTAPTVTVGGAQAEVLFAGLTPGFVGLAQLNIRLPDQLPGTGSTATMVVDFAGRSGAPVELRIERP